MVSIAFWQMPASRTSRAEESERARVLLSALFQRLYGRALPTVTGSASGKPCFEDSGEPHFNISHSGGAVAVALCDTDPVGIDVQERVEPGRAKRIGMRFPYVKGRSSPAIEEYRFFSARLCDGELELTEEPIAPARKDESFTAAWCLTEAYLKAEGGGFASAKALDELENHSKTLEFKIGDFYIAVAKSSTIC